jgi:hypothetical protein
MEATMQTISKICADHLRSFANQRGVKLKASHAHELVAAVCGYKTAAAMQNDGVYPIERLKRAEVIVLMNTAFIEQRRACLQDLPSDLPDNYELGFEVYSSLLSQGLTSSNPWPAYSFLAQKVADDYLLRQGHLILGPMIRANEIFGRGPLAEGIKEELLDDRVNLVVARQYYGSHRLLPLMAGDRIELTITVSLQRVAGHIGFTKPQISHEVVDPNRFGGPELHGFADTMGTAKGRP